MHSRSAPVILTVPLPAADYRAFRNAARSLRRLLGKKAPGVPDLVSFNLQGQDARGITDFYLDRIGHPPGFGRAVTLRRVRLVARTTRRASRPLLVGGGPKPPADLSRN